MRSTLRRGTRHWAATRAGTSSAIDTTSMGARPLRLGLRDGTRSAAVMRGRSGSGTTSRAKLANGRSELLSRNCLVCVLVGPFQKALDELRCCFRNLVRRHFAVFVLVQTLQHHLRSAGPGTLLVFGHRCVAEDGDRCGG